MVTLIVTLPPSSTKKYPENIVSTFNSWNCFASGPTRDDWKIDVYIYICIIRVYIYTILYIWQQIWLGSWLDYTMIIMNLLWLDTRCRLSTSRGNILGKIVPKLSTAWFSFHTPQVPHMKKGSISSQKMKTSVEGVWDRISFFQIFWQIAAKLEKWHN